MPDAKATFRLEGEDATAAAFRSALGNVQDFSEKATRMLKGAFGFEIAVQLTESIKGVAELGDNLVKGAERAGIAQAQFNQLAAAFGEADISVQSLSRGIKNMEVAISKGANGDTTIASAFNEIGLSAESLKRLAPDVELLAIAEALSKVEDPTDRARIGMVLLGKSFLELEPVLAKGAAGLDEMVRAANGIDAQTSENLAKFNEQLNHLKGFFGSQIANDISYFAKAVQQVKDQFSPDMQTRIEQIQTMLKSPENWGVERVKQLTQELKDLRWELANSGTEAPNVSAALDEQGKGIAERVQDEFTQAAVAAMKAQDEVEKKNKETLDQWEEETRTASERVAVTYLKTEELFKAGRINRAEEFARDNQAGFTKQMASDSAENQAAIAQSIKQSSDSMREAYTAMSEEAKAAEATNKRLFEETGRYAVQTGDLIQGTFARAFENIGQGGLRGLVADFVKAFARIVAEAEAMDLAKAMGLQNAFSNQGGGSALGGIFSGLGSFFGAGGDSTAVTFNGGAGTASLLGFAGGGSFNVGGAGGTDSQIVAFRATPGEQVSVKTPGQQGGGVTVINNNYIDSRTDSTQIAQLIQASTQRAVQQSKSEMTQLIKRGAFA